MEQCSLPVHHKNETRNKGISGQMVKNSSCKKLLQFRLQDW